MHLRRDAFVRQTWALARKTLLIAAARHWFSTLFRAVILPIAFMVFLVHIKYLVYPKNGFGIGSPALVVSLLDALPDSQKLVFVVPPDIGHDVPRLIEEVTLPLRNQKRIVSLKNETDLLTTCRESLAGASDCFAAVVFNDSPLTIGKNGIWDYTIRANSNTEGKSFQVHQHDSDEESVFLPLQVALDSGITNITVTPEEYMFTTISQRQEDENVRRKYQQLIIAIYGIVFFISFSSQIYHLVGMMTTERASGMAQLIDAMGGNPAIRICSYILSFNIIYAPSWIAFGILLWYEVFRSSSVLISLVWQILTGMALTSASVFAAMFFSGPQLSSICSTLGFLIVGLIGLLVDKGTFSTGAVAILSLFFPSMNYMFMLGYMCRYEEQGLAINLLRAPKPTQTQSSSSQLPGIVLWTFLVLQVFYYPILAAYAEGWIHETASTRRTMGVHPWEESAVETSGLTKIYQPTLGKKWFTRPKAKDVVAVSDLNLVARCGQITCLLGANGSGKTTTLEMIGGFRRPTSGSVHVSAGRGQLGICPQRNVLWDELTVKEHVTTWNAIKLAGQETGSLDGVIDACGLKQKQNSRSGTLSGGQKRKLQLACMLVGSTVCLLDEVSSGLDPLSRRSLWDILLTERFRRTMIITTQFLDEVDILADHVVIISRGRLKSEGSTVELKTRYARGYKLLLEYNNPGIDVAALRTHLAKQKVLEAPDSAAVIRLLTDLEGSGYADISITGPTIEDVFVSLCDESQPSQAESSDEFVRSSFDHHRTQMTTTTAAASEMDLSSGAAIAFWIQVKILFLKRLAILRRNWWPYLIAIAIPIITTPLLKDILFYYHIPSCKSTVALNVHSVQPVNILAASERIGHMRILAGPPSVNDSLYEVVSRFPIGYGLDPHNYSNLFVFADTFVNIEDRVSREYSSITPGALYMGGNFSAPTYAFAGDAGIFPAMIMQNLWSQVKSGIEISLSYAPFDGILPPTAGASISYIAFFALAQAVYPALFTLYPTYEKRHKVRAMQYSNGVRVLPLWVSYAMFDFIFVIVVSIICTVIVAAEAPSWFGVGYLFPVLLLYGVCAILLSYVVSLIAGSQLAAFAVAAGGQAITVLLILLAFTLVEFFASYSNIQGGVDAITFALDLVFPVGNVIRALLVGLNVCAVSCRNGVHISYGGSIYAYGGPVLYLCVQIVFLFSLLLWLDRGHLSPRAGRWLGKDDQEQAPWSARPEVEDEKTRVLASESDPVRVLGVMRHFGTTVAVDSATFGIRKGEIFVLLGPNGAGKSTLFDMIRGQLRPSHGEVLLQGYDIVTQRHQAERSLGACPQFDALDFMTTREHLRFYARIKGVTEVERDVNIILDKLGLKEYENRHASKLSGGNQRKLSLAIALLGNPPVLLLDEPSSSMDAVSKRIMWKTIMQVTTGRSLLLTTHSMEEADALATRAAIISTHLLSIGTTRFLRKMYGNLYHVHLMLKSAPTSTKAEIQAVEHWITRNFVSVRLNPFGNYHGQIKFSLPASSSSPIDDELHHGTVECISENVKDEIRVSSKVQPKTTNTAKTTSIARTLFTLLENNKDTMGIAHYSIAPTTLEEVFLNILSEDSTCQAKSGGR